MSSPITQATTRYEDWLGTLITIERTDLQKKHQDMAADVVRFLRATFYRWAEVWPRVCPALAAAPVVLSVGDLHVENFGSWRDPEARLIWGANDYDEAYPLPYPNDLCRLATSALLAISAEHLSIGFEAACEAILTGYRTGLLRGVKPFVLEERHRKLRQVALAEVRDPVRFWKRMDALAPARTPPAAMVAALEAALPEHDLAYDLRRRQAGEGSLGRTRVVALATWRGARIAREAKACVPSACVLIDGAEALTGTWAQSLLNKIPHRDPFVVIRDGWITRRLAPHCSRIELAALPAWRDERVLLKAMGREAANMHLSDPGATADALLAHLDSLPAPWLREAAREMAAVTRKDWKDWKRTFSHRQRSSAEA